MATDTKPQIVYPEPYGSYVVKRSTVSLWTRVAGRALMLFSVDRTPHEMALVFEALQDAHIRIEECEARIGQLSDELKLERKLRREADATLSDAMAANGI